MADVPTAYEGGDSRIDTAHNQFVVFDSTSPHKDVSEISLVFLEPE